MVTFEQSFFGGEGILQKNIESKHWKVCAPTVVSPLVWCCTQLLLVGSVTIEIYTNVLWVEPSSRPSLPRMFDCHHCHHPKNIAPINWWALGMSFFFPDFQFMEGPNFGFCISHVCLRFEWACWFHAVQKVLVFGPISNGQLNPSCWGLASARISGSLINEPNRRRFWKRNLENC